MNAPRLPDWRGESYYGRPPLKTPQWDWKVSGYIAVAGVAGAAQTLAWIGARRDREGFARAQRTADVLALTGSAAGAGLLIADLETPRRFYNMLRILRPTSPMSFGTYIFGAFSTCSAIAAAAGLPALARRPWLRRLGGAARAGAALSGVGLASYTPALLAATSSPYWAAAPRPMGAQFATSSLAGGAAALALGERAGGRRDTAQRLEDVAAVATLAHLGATQAAERRRREVDVPQASEGDPNHLRSATADLLIAGAAPLASYALNRATRGRAPAAAVAGSLAVLAGGWLARDAILRIGKASARDPQAAFGLAQPRNLPAPPRTRELPR